MPKGKITDDVPTGSVTFRLAPETIKHLQKYPWMSPEWKKAYGQRNQVEASNKTLKEPTGGNLGNTHARTGRGFAYTYLASIMGVMVTNIKRIITGVRRVTAAQVEKLQPSNTRPVASRARRRRDSLGERLTKTAPPGQ